MQFLESRERHSPPALEAGSIVKVVDKNIKLFHVPSSRGKPYSPYGHVGSVIYVEKDEHLTANRPVLVKITRAPCPEGVEDPGTFKPFTAHFAPEELCICKDEGHSVAGAGAQTSASSSSGAAEAPSTAMAVQDSSDDRWRINLLYDGECPSCMKQVEFLTKRMDENPEYAGLVRLTNLHAPDYSPENHGGVVFEDGMRHIHAVTRDGEVIVGMDVFRRIYAIVGMEWVYSITTLPVIGGLCDWLYDRWAEYRLQMIGRDDLKDKVREHQAKIQELSQAQCEVECEVDWDNMTYAGAGGAAVVKEN